MRLKENIVDLDSCWELLKTAQPKKYNWIDGKEEDVGFIAQEVYRIDELKALKPVGEI